MNKNKIKLKSEEEFRVHLCCDDWNFMNRGPLLSRDNDSGARNRLLRSTFLASLRRYGEQTPLRLNFLIRTHLILLSNRPSLALDLFLLLVAFDDDDGRCHEVAEGVSVMTR